MVFFLRLFFLTFSPCPHFLLFLGSLGQGGRRVKIETAISEKSNLRQVSQFLKKNQDQSNAPIRISHRLNFP
jgi:hypothetical protein